MRVQGCALVLRERGGRIGTAQGRENGGVPSFAPPTGVILGRARERECREPIVKHAPCAGNDRSVAADTGAGGAMGPRDRACGAPEDDSAVVAADESGGDGRVTRDKIRARRFRSNGVGCPSVSDRSAFAVRASGPAARATRGQSQRNRGRP